MTDIIEQAEAKLKDWPRVSRSLLVPELIAELKVTRAVVTDYQKILKAERAQRYNASTLSEDVIAHVLADIDQVCNEDQWPLRQRLEVIQKICDGSEYAHD